MKKIFSKIMEMNIVKLYIVTLVCHFLYSFVVGAILYTSGVAFSQHVASSSDFSSSLFLIPMCALVEEGIFRWMPMLLFCSVLSLLERNQNLSKRTTEKIEKYGVMLVVILMSVVFGFVHGNVFNILLQGVSSVIFYMFYLRTLYKRKEEGKIDKHQIRPLLSSTLYHTLSNAILVIL